MFENIFYFSKTTTEKILKYFFIKYFKQIKQNKINPNSKFPTKSFTKYRILKAQTDFSLVIGSLYEIHFILLIAKDYCLELSFSNEVFILSYKIGKICIVKKTRSRGKCCK